MKDLRSRLLAAASAIALAFAAGGASADTGTATSQIASHADAAVFWAGQANQPTSCNAVSQTSAQDTITITPPAGQSVYLTELLMQFSTDATGATAVPTVSSTNLQGGAANAPILSAATTLSTTGYHADLAIPFPAGGLKSATPGTAVTFVPSAAMGAHSILCMSAIGYFAQ